MRGRGYGVCIPGLILWAMVASRLERFQLRVKTKPTLSTAALSTSPRLVYKPTDLQPTVRVLWIRFDRVETSVDTFARVSVLRFAPTSLVYPHRACLITLFFSAFRINAHHGKRLGRSRGSSKTHYIAWAGSKTIHCGSSLTERGYYAPSGRNMSA
jgi:hypothetical protein